MRFRVVGEFEHWAEMIDLHMRVNLRWGKQDKTVPNFTQEGLLN